MAIQLAPALILGGASLLSGFLASQGGKGAGAQPASAPGISIAPSANVPPANPNSPRLALSSSIGGGRGGSPGTSGRPGADLGTILGPVIRDSADLLAQGKGTGGSPTSPITSLNTPTL